jgi:hypothetical protein
MGAALAITVMPHRNRLVVDAIDPVAKELVCSGDEPRVCVSRVHSRLLREVIPQAREALAILARLPDAPTQVHEDTTTYFPDVYPPWHADVVLLSMEAGGPGVLAEVVYGAFASPPGCEKSAGPAEKLAAAYWLMGREPVGREPVGIATYDPADVAAAVELWQKLRRLPAGEADARVVALRRAAVNCTVADGALSRGTR